MFALLNWAVCALIVRNKRSLYCLSHCHWWLRWWSILNRIATCKYTIWIQQNFFVELKSMAASKFANTIAFLVFRHNLLSVCQCAIQSKLFFFIPSICILSLVIYDAHAIECVNFTKVSHCISLLLFWKFRTEEIADDNGIDEKPSEKQKIYVEHG